MKEYFKQFYNYTLYEMSEFIRCSEEYNLDEKQQLLDTINCELKERNLTELMLPIAREFIKQ